MSDERLKAVASAIRAGDKPLARNLLRPILQTNPTADSWYLAAHVANSREQSITFLNKALELDPFHEGASRRLATLEHSTSVADVAARIPETLSAKHHQIQSKRVHGCTRWLTILGATLIGIPILILFSELNKDESIVTVAICGLLLFPFAAFGGFRYIARRWNAPPWFRTLSRGIAVVVVAGAVTIGIVLDGNESQPTLSGLSDQEQRVWQAVDNAVSDEIRSISITNNEVSLTYDVDIPLFSLSADSIDRDLVEIACALRKDGFTSYSFRFTARIHVVDAYGNEGMDDGVLISLASSTVRKLNCDSPYNVNLPFIADSYYSHPTLR